MKQYFLEKGRIFSIRKLTVGVASVTVGLTFFASGNVAANELVTEPKLEVDSQAKEVADVDHEKEEAVKEEVTEKKEPAVEKTVEEAKPAEVAGDLLPEEISDRAYPDTPVKKVDTSAIVSEKESPQVETKSILKPTEAVPSEGEKENRAIINGGQDLKHINYEGQPATSATMVYSIFSSPLANGGSQRYLNSGSGIFVAPNIMLTVAHNFLVKDADTNAGSIRGGDTAKFYYNVGSNTAKNNSLPTSGNTILFKEKDIHFWNKEKFGEGYKNDLALVVAPVPLSIASPNKAATFTPLAEHREYKAGEPVSTIGYPTDSTSPELKEPIVPGQLYKADGVVKGTEKYDDKGTVGVTYRLTSVSGLSGGGIINGEGKVIGIHQRGTVDNANIAEKDRFGGGLVLSPEQLAWVKEIIDKYGVKGWYQGDNGNRYYFTPEGEMLRNKTAVIGENKYSFDESGVATLLEGVDYGRVVVEHLDQNDNPVKENDTFVEKTEVGTQFDYNYKIEIEKTDFFKKNKEKYEIVSIDGKTVNKQLKDAWEDDYSVVSKAPAGTRVIKVVYKVNKGSFDVHYRLKGTDQELATATVDNNDGKEYEVSFVHRFQAKDIAGYRAVNASQEATIQHKGVNEVIFEYEKIEDPKPATPATPVVDPKDEETEIAAYGPLPSKAQLDYHKEELAAFIHYGMNTYTNSEWGNGRENPQNFNPTNLDTDQWIKTLKDAGFKRTIMVVKHHDGFVIYPSKYTDHTVAASPWKDGKGDLLEEISKSATKYDMNMGVYLSPWDANNPKYHVSTEKEYNEYYLNQLKEILGNPKYGNNGKFIEVWMDGARGSGAQKVTYTFDEWFKYIKEAEGDIAIFSAQPTSVRWIGNERGIAGDPVWHKVKKAKITDDVKNEYLNHGDPEGDMYSVGEADVSIRSGWFYHDNQQPKSIKDLMDIYFKSVGRGTPLLLNIPPNKEGKFADADVARLKEFRATLDQMYATDFAKGATVTASSTRKNHLYQASNLTDGKDDTSWALSNDAKTGEFTVDLGQKRRFDVVELKEDIAKGQRISGFKVEVELNGRWVPYGEGSTVGYRRLVQGQPVEAQKIRVTITNSQATPILTNFSVYKTPSSIEKTDGYPLGLDYHSNTTADKANTTWYDESEGVRGTSMWTNQKDASVTYRFNGTKAYVVSTVDPNHGEMSVYVDGQKVADVQTNNAARKRSQMVYETDDLAPGEHTIKLVNKTGKAIATEGIYTLNNAGKGMFELKETTYEVQKGQPVTVTIKRVGGSKGAATVHVVTEPGTGVHGKVYKDTTADLTFQEGETEKTLTIPTIDFTEQADSIFDFKVKMTSASDEALLGFASEATIRVMKAELLQKDQVSHDDQASQLDYSPGWHHETNSSGKYQNTESWASFGRLTEEQKKNASVTAYFYGTGLEIKGFVDPGHGIYKVTLDGRRVEYQDGLGNASEYNGKKYFSGTAATRQGDQTLVRLTGLEEGWHAVTLQLDPKRNDITRNIGIQVDQFITRGEGSALYTKEELLQAMKNWKDELDKFDQTSLKNTPEARQAFKSNLDKLSEQLSASDAKPQEVLKTAAALQTILDKEENYGVEETPAQPEEPKIDYDKAMASLAEAIQNKTKELGDDKEAKKKLVELSEQALVSIQEAKTQDAVDKALQAALTSINQLQATPKEDPKPEEPAQPEEPKIDYDKAMASLAEAIQNKTKELGDDKEAKKKLVELSEQALVSIQEAKTQDAVDKALQAALTSINQLQATPKEDPKPEEPAQPEEPKIDYDKAMASLAEAIQNKTKELGDDKEAKKKLVELSEQALVSIQEAKTQDAVDKALQAALTSINQLQATPKEDPKPEEPAQPEEPKIDYDKAMASLAEAIQNKTKELGDDKEAKKKLVELSEQALVSIQEAKTQDAVDKALQAALTSINQLQATPKEDPKPEEPAQPEEPKIDYDKAMASLAEAIRNKTKELGNDKEAKKKLVELSEQAIAAIEAAKTQDAVDQALQAALTSINQLQATPKEDPKPEEPAQPEEPKIDYDKAMASLAEAIQNKTKELGDDKEAKKKLVELSEQALVSIQEAKTQDAVDKALQAALTSINQLQATPKEDPKPEEPAQPEEPKIDYDKAMASLAEAIQNKTKELGDDKEAKKKLVELSEQALVSIQEAKTQDAVDKALQAALTSINQLQATPKEDPKPEEPAQPEEPKIDYDKAMASLAEAIQNKTKELGDDKEAKKKLVELSEQALVSIQEAKTQDAVDKALQAALTSINQLQATPKEDPKPEEPAQPEEPKIDYDKAMASLAEAIRNKTKELGNDKEAKKKLVELSEQAIAAIEAAKTQDAVDQALQAALTSINQLQATPKEDPKPEEPAQPEEPKIDYDKAMASLAEAIRNKTKELGDDKEAKKKLVELSEQALTAIEAAKTQDAVDKALQAALTSINQLQATPKEEVKHSVVPTEGDMVLVQAQPSLEVVEEAINFKTVKQEDPTLPEGETRVTQVGRAGKERILTEVAPDGSRITKLREVVEVAQDEIVLVGTKKEESGKTEAAIHEVPEFTGGVNGSEAAIHEVPEFTGGVNGSEVAIHEVPEFTGGVNGSEAAIHEVPEFTGGVNGAEATVHRVLNFEGGVPGGESPIYKVLAFTGGVNGTTPATHEIATYKDEQAQVVQAMLQDKIDQASVNRKNTLPETGEKETTGLATLGVVGALLGLSALGKKKEDQ